MAGIGSAWGSREEMLHPRDRHGRFRKKWKMAASVVDALSSFLDRFQPRSFQSDQQASQYAFNARKAPWTTPELERLHMDWDEANDSLQAGEMDDTTKKFVAMMDRNMVETTDDLIVSQTVPPEAFGMSAQQAQMEDGGLEDLIGLEIADAGYSATNLGSELSHPPGSITLRVAVPKGTRVAYGGRSPNDRSLIFDRDQPLVVTKVEPDGRGGWYMLAIAGSGARTKGATAVADDRTHGRRGAGLTPQQREARISPRMSGETRLQTAMKEQQANEAATLANQRQVAPELIRTPGQTPAQSPAPAAPASPQTPASPATGVPERQEPVLKESVGPGSPEGKSASDIASDAETARVQAENAPPAPAAPPTPLEFQEAARTLPIPTSGPQRNEWNKAHRDLAQGRRDPGDVLRELDTDIDENKRKAATATHAEKKDSLERNIQAQEQLADLIAEKYGVQRQTTSAPVTKKAPAATPGAPSTDRGAAPTVKAPEAAPDRRTKAQLLEEAGDAGRPRMTKDQLRKAIEDRKGGGEVTPAPAKVAKKTAAPVPAKKAAPEAMVPGDQRVPDTESPAIRQANESLRQAAKKAVPAKAVPSPVDAEEEAFKQRVKDAGLPDKVTELRARAKAEKIRGFSTMNKKQLQQALLGDTVNTSNKIGVVPPAKMIPHLEAAESDSAARALLEKHTLVDLKALAKEREIKLPSRGATKGKVTDMVLEDIRGPQEGIGGRTPDTSLNEDLDQLGYIDLPGANGDQIKQQIAQVDGDDPDSLRTGRDNLEKASKQFRSDGDKNAANMAQAAADAMGMRAQTISGVEEGAPPVKRVAKKAVPEVDVDAEPEPKTLDKMLKPELEDLARKEGVTGIRKSMTKTQIREAIERNRRMDSSRGSETDEERQRRELGQLPGGPERDLGPNQGPLRLPDRAPTPEEIARDATPEAPAAPVKKATKKAAKKAVADVDKAADNVSGQLKETFGDTLRQTDAEELRQAVKEAGLGDIEGGTAEEIFDNTIKKALEDRMRELGMLPEDPKKPTRAQKRVPKGSVAGPKADVPIATPGRREAFTEAWDSQGFVDDPSMTEVRDRIAAGELTHEEGVRRLESEIAFHEDEMSDLGAELEGMAPEDRNEESGIADGIHARRAELSDAITNNRKAIKFLRTHAKDEAPVTREELEIQLDGPEKAALDRVDVDSLKEAARQEGLGDIDGDDKDTVIQNIAKAVAGREMANREKERKAVQAQERKDVVRKHAEAISGIESVLDGSDKAVAARIRSQSKSSDLSPEIRKDLLGAAGDRDALRGVLDRVALAHGLERTDTRGQNTHFDPERHDLPPGSGLKKGDAVTVLEPGLRADVAGEGVQFKKAKVTEGHSPVVESLAAPAKKAPAKRITKKAAQAARDEESAAGIATLARGGNNEPLIEGAPPRKAAKAAVPAKAAPKAVDLDNPTRHNAELIGTGLDLDPKGEDRQWLDVVQRDLDRGTDGRQIADGLRREADSQRTLHNIQESVGGTEGASPAARINRMELMADRLEGVRPLAKATPAKAAPEAGGAGPAKREMDTMQAARAQSEALRDLRNGKSHAEVATALRARATSVGAKEHDVETVRPLEFTPSERSAMKRNDAKRLRELAAEIQAQGVAQRAAAKATKKAAPAKKARTSARDDAVATGLMDRIQELDPERVKEILAGISPEDRKELDAARERDTARRAAKVAAPKKRTAAEMRRARSASENEGVPVEQILERWDGQKEDRKNLTGPVGEMIAQMIDDAVQRATAAPDDLRASHELQALPHSEMRTLADRVGVSRSGTKAELGQRIIARMSGTEAPTTSAERAVPKVEAPGDGVNESEPLKPFPHDDNMRMHADSPTMGLAFAYEKAGRNGSANRMADLRYRATAPKGTTTPQQVVDELKAIRAQETDPKFQRMLDRAIDANDAPMTPIPDLPPDLPPSLRKLMEDLHAIPYARKGPRSEAAIGVISGPSLVDQLAEVFWDASRGERGPRRQHPQDRIRDILRGKTHEMNEASFRLWEMVSRLESDEPLDVDAGRKVADLVKELRDWERSHWPPQ